MAWRWLTIGPSRATNSATTPWGFPGLEFVKPVFFFPQIAAAALAGCLVAPVLMASELDASRMQDITRAYDEREYQPGPDNSTEAHRSWISSPKAKEDIAYMTAHYEAIPSLTRSSMVTELARTGLPEIVPFINRALADDSDGTDALPGIFYGCHLANATDSYRKGLAEGVARWCIKDSHEQDDAIRLLPHLDKEVARRTLLSDKLLSASNPHIVDILTGCNSACLTIPLEQLEPLLAAWQATAHDPNSAYPIRRGYTEAVQALAAHAPARAIALAEAGVKATPHDSSNWAAVLLAAAGLTGLYDRLCDFNEPTSFATLPEPAKIYFSISYFEGDSSNGGVGQALGNPTGDYLPWVKKGYEAIGDKQASSWLAAMCKPFGETGPAATQEKRLQQMEAMKPNYWEQEDALFDAWSKSQPDDGRPGVEWMLAAYVVRHADALRPLLKKK